MKTCTVTTFWVGTGTPTDPFRPKAAGDYPFSRWVDQTNAPGGQGVTYFIEADMSDLVYMAMLVDVNYGPSRVILKV